VIKKESTHIVAIGIGLSNATDLAKIASNNSYFLYNSYDNLRNVFTYLKRTANSPPKIDINARGSHSATLQVSYSGYCAQGGFFFVFFFDMQLAYK
jgi:hypothetical protein